MPSIFAFSLGISDSRKVGFLLDEIVRVFLDVPGI